MKRVAVDGDARRTKQVPWMWGESGLPLPTKGPNIWAGFLPLKKSSVPTCRIREEGEWGGDHGNADWKRGKRR